MRLHTDGPPASIAEYVAQLRGELAVLERWNAEPYATNCRRTIDDLTAITEAEGAALLTLRDAAAECGYSEDQLGRLVKGGRLRNYGRPGAPAVRRDELPRRPTSPLLSAERAANVGTSRKSIARRITGAG